MGYFSIEGVDSMKVRILEKISNGSNVNAVKKYRFTSEATGIASEILKELQNKGASIRSLVRINPNRKGTVVVYIPSSLRTQVRREFDLSQEPTEFNIQCKSGVLQDSPVILVSAGFSTGSSITDPIEDWVIEDPIDGTESRTVSSSRKIDFTLNKLSDIFGLVRGRQGKESK